MTTTTAPEASTTPVTPEAPTAPAAPAAPAVAAAPAAEEEDQIATSLERTAKAFRRYPQMPIAQAFEQYLQPLLEQLRDEYINGFADVQEQIESMADALDAEAAAGDELLQQGLEIVAAQAGLLTAAYMVLGWVKDNAPDAAKFPADQLAAFQAVGTRTLAWMEATGEYLSTEEDTTQPAEGSNT